MCARRFWLNRLFPLLGKSCECLFCVNISLNHALLVFSSCLCAPDSTTIDADRLVKQIIFSSSLAMCVRCRISLGLVNRIKLIGRCSSSDANVIFLSFFLLWRLVAHYVVWFVWNCFVFVVFFLFVPSYRITGRPMNGAEWSEAILFLYFSNSNNRWTTATWNRAEGKRKWKRTRPISLALLLSRSLTLSRTPQPSDEQRELTSLRMQTHFKYLKLYLL